MMKTRLLISLLLVSLFFSTGVYAHIDPISYVQTGVELKQEIEKKIQDIKQLKENMTKRLTQGFSECMSNPLECDGTLTDMIDNTKLPMDRIKGFPVMGNLQKNITNFVQTPSDDIMKNVRSAYTYRRGQGEDLQNTMKNREEINSVTNTEISELFAKGITTRHGIQLESGESYEDPRTKNGETIEAMNKALVTLDLQSLLRLVRIAEIRSFMVGAPATADMIRHSIAANDKDDE